MVYHGRVKGGVIELDEDNRLPEGTRVRIEPEKIVAHTAPLGEDPIGRLGRNPIRLGIVDAARELDRYLYCRDK